MISEKKQLRGFVPAAYVVLTHKLVRQTTGRPAPWPVGHSRLFAQTREELCGLSSVQPVQTGLSGCWQHVHCWRMGDIAQGRARFSQRPLRTGQEWFLEFSNHTREALRWGYLMMLHHSPSDCCVNTAGKWLGSLVFLLLVTNPLPHPHPCFPQRSRHRKSPSRVVHVPWCLDPSSLPSWTERFSGCLKNHSDLLHSFVLEWLSTFPLTPGPRRDFSEVDTGMSCNASGSLLSEGCGACSRRL